MKTLPVFACLLTISALTASGQVRPGRSTTPTRPRVAAPDLSPNATIFLSGTVVIEDGSPLTESASIQTICRGQKRTEAHTDSHGSFTFQFGSTTADSEVGFDVDTPSRSSVPARFASRNLRDCQLQASLAGFVSDVVELSGRFSGDQSGDVGRVVLRRMANVEGFTISVTTAQAPHAARKALEKGQEQEKKNKWEDAQKSLEKAVSLDSKFAVAWYELGRVQQHKNDLAGARNSYQQSIAADSKYVNPYHGLTQLAQHEQHWQELIDVTGKLLALNPVSFPEVWLSNSVGHYCVQDFAAAEKSARRGLELDIEHRVPKLQYLLGMVLLKKPDYQEAAQHLRAFVQATTNPNEIAEAQKHLDDAERLSAAATLSTHEGK